MERGGFWNLLKATRVYRVLPTLMIILAAAGFAGFINQELILLGFVGILIYSANGLFNSIKDEDYSLSSKSKFFSLFLLIIALAISFVDRVILFTALAAIFLGLIYNYVSRFILLVDTTILSVTHFALPFFSSLILLGFDVDISLKLSGFMFAFFWFFSPSKNLKGVQEDRKRNYKTLPILFRQGKLITILLFVISFVLIVGSYFVFDLNSMFLFFLFLIFVLYLFAIRDFLKERNLSALHFSRMILLLFLFGIIIGKTSDLLIIFLGVAILLLYFLLLGVNKKSKEASWEV